jgi:hypothetical protein
MPLRSSWFSACDWTPSPVSLRRSFQKRGAKSRGRAYWERIAWPRKIPKNLNNSKWVGEVDEGFTIQHSRY